MKKKILAVFILSLFTAMHCIGAYAIEYNIDEVIGETAGYIIKTADNPTIENDWDVFSVVRSDYPVPDEYIQRYITNAKNVIAEQQGILHERKYTEYSRVILALTAVGENPVDIEGYNLFTPLADYEKTISQGINGAIFALLAIDSNHYDIPEKNMYLDYILSHQNPDGGFSLGGGTSDIDITAMALQALAKYKTDERAAGVISKALDYLSANQNENGGFGTADNESSEHTAQVITALCELGTDPANSDFIKNGQTLEDSLMSYYIDGGGFCHIHSIPYENRMSTQQALYALASVKRLRENKTSVYDMTDVNNKITRFSDIQNHQCAQAAESLAAHGIISGKSENIFDPDSGVTRAEFAAMIIRALGNPRSSESYFTDCSINDWFYEYVNAAYEKGIIKGISETEFNPYGNITREEAAVMLMRSAAICGIEIMENENVGEDILLKFSDYADVSSWAQNAVIFCINENVITNTVIMPQEYISRGETAQMLYSILLKANILQGD